MEENKYSKSKEGQDVPQAKQRKKKTKQINPWVQQPQPYRNWNEYKEITPYYSKKLHIIEKSERDICLKSLWILTQIAILSHKFI